MTSISDGAKRRKTRDIEWKITFDQVQCLQKLLDIISNVLTHVTMKIKVEGEAKIEIDSIDSKKICMVQARLGATSGTGTNGFICVKSKPLLTCLGSCPSHYSIDITKYVDSSSIYMRSYESLSNSHIYEAEIKTIMDESEPCRLNDLTYKYNVEMDLLMLRGIVKTAHSLSSEDIRFQVLEPPPGSFRRRLTAFRISAEGADDATPANVFVSEVDADSNIIRTEETVQSEIAIEDMTIVYDQKFSSQYLNYFFKSMERTTLTMKLSEDKPLVLDYPLGKDNSYITFVLAARNVE